jgi:hypothetical protein
MNAAERAYAEHLRSLFAGLVPPGNSETLYLRPVIEAACRIIWVEGQVAPQSALLARAIEQRLKRVLIGRSQMVAEPLVSSTELRDILLEAIGG